MKNFLRVTVLAICAIFMVANVSAQDNYDATTMGSIVRYYETAKWAQGSPFNNQCWTNATQQTHAKTGCVPTAFAIIMRHHGFPAEGIGTLYNQQTGEVFTDRTYDYSKMPLTGASGWTTEQQNEVAKLMAHLGHAFGVTFGSGTTSVSIGNTMSERMQNFFNYNYAPVSNQYAGSGQMYDFEEWKKNLKNSLDNGCPVPYAADNKKDGTNDTRHMFVIDGYTENEYFHFNFGWGGGSNGWYKLDDITPTGDDYSWRTTSDGYDSRHQAFFNLMPNTTTYAVTATVNDSNMGTVSINNGTAGSTATANLMQGVTATLTAHPAQGYALASWTKNGVVVGSRTTLEVKVGTDANDYVANFDDEANVLVEKDCKFTITDVTTSGVSGSYCSTWTTADGIVLSCTKGSEPAYALSTTVNTFFAKAPVGSSETLVSDITYTLTAPAGYIIKSYSFKGKSPSSSYTIDVTVGGNTTNITSASAGVVVSASDINAQSTSFVLSSTYAGRAGLAIMDGVTVTIQSEGGGSTQTPTTYAITTAANPAEGGTAKFAVGTGSQLTQGNVNNDEQITLYAAANTGYTFVNWTLNGNEVSTSATCNVTVSQAANYVANFEAEAAAEQFPDGAYKIYWQADNRGYLAYHATDYPNEAKLAGVGYSGCQNIHYAVNEVDLVWYLITADDGKRYLFQAATGKFLGVDTSIQANGTGNKLSTTEAWPIAIEENTNSTRLGHYIITTNINGTNSLLCSGCGTEKAGHPVRWLDVNDSNQKDGGAPLQLISVNDVTVSDDVMNAVLAVINGTDEPADPLAGKYFRLKEKSTGTYMNIYDNATHSDGAKGGVNVTSLSESSDGQIFQFITSGTGYMLQSATGYYINCQAWNVDANSTTSGAVLTLESTANELEYLIHCSNGYFKIGAVEGNASIGKFVYCNEANKTNATTWVLEEVIPSNEKTLTVTYSGATWNNEASGWWVSVVTNTTPAVTVKTTDGTPKIGYSTVNSVRHPYLLDGNSFTISVPANCKITGYRLGYQAHNLVSKSVTYTNGKQSTGTVTIAQSNEQNTLTVTGLDNNEISFSVEDQSSQAGFIIKSLEITYIENEFEPLPFKAEIEGWRNDNPNTHLGTITVGGTAMKLTPAHQTASELTMPVAEGTALAFTRKYRGFEFQGFYIGATLLGTNPTLTADNVAAINETTPLVAKFTATDDVTLFYDDDQYSYRIPAIAKTGNGMLVAVSDYRHNLDDIGRDNHGTGTKRIDLVMRTSTDNGATWSETMTIAAGDNSKTDSYLRAFGDAAIAAVGQNIVVMAAAGDVLYTAGTTSSPNKMARIYSTDNGATWTIEEMTTKMYSQSTSLIPSGGSAFFGSGKLAVDPNFNGTGNARIYGALLVRIGTDGYNNFGVFSDDLGATWKILGGDNTNPVAKGDEPKVEILPNGQILLSARRGGGRVFRVFTYGDDKANGAGSWGDDAVNGCDNGGSNATNGEIICLDAKRPNGTATKILLQSQPKGGSGQYDRKDVTIWYKEVSADETYTSATIASGWTMGKQVSTVQSSYSAMALQENGEIALFFEEAPCYGNDYTKGYSMVYVPLTIEEITNNNFLNPNADVEYVPVEFSIVLTDAQDNEYRETIDYIPADVAAVESYLTTTYPFITLGTTGAIAENKYTNTVTLPFKVSNANTTVWHNIYFPANGTSAGEYYPIYLMAENENATAVAKITEKVHYGNSQYNTYNYADKLAWAVYNVNEGFTFKFKNKLTGKFMAVTGVSSDNTNNVVYTDEAGATAFTLEKYTGGNASYGNYAIKSVYNSTTGYVCNTSVGYTYATNYPGTGHAGAWVKFVESPDYWTIYNQLIADINNFGTGDGKYTENDDINNIDIDALASMPLNSLNTKAEEVQTVKESYREVVLTVNDDETATVPGSVSITVNGSDAETVNNKFVPANATVSILATANPGYRFVNWTRPAAQASAAARTAEARNSDVVSDQNPYTVTVSEALNLEANFEEIVVNATLTDAQSNTYNVQLSGFTTEITKDAVAEKLREAYPYITLGTTDQNGDVIDFGALNIDGTAYTYTNRVELPFKVTNTTYIWHNIYWPSNTKAYDYPVYLSASTADDVYVPKVTGNYAYGDHPTYNTKSGNDNISWAIYNVNNGFEFIFKNKVTQKYIRIRNVADKDAQNVQYVENAEDATAFTIEMKPEGQTYDTDAKYALTAMFGETKGYLCSTSVGYGWVTHYYNANNNGYGHQGAWIEFKESPDYFSKIMDLGIILGLKFGAGDGKYIITDEISVIDNAIANNSDNLTLNTLNSYASTMEDAMNNWPAVGLTIYPAEGGTTNINGEENVVHKYVPNEYELPLVAVPAEGYHFVNWTDGTSEIETTEYTKTISGGKGDVIELTANFAKNSYTVNVSTNGTGGSATASAATVEHGSEVTLTAGANSGYKFAGWYNGEVLVSAEANYTFTVTSDINYTARFEEEAGETPTTHAMHIIVSSTDGTDVTNSENGNVKAVFEMNNDWIRDYDFADGADVILVATPDYRQQAYLFDGWYKNGVLVSNELSYTVRATEAATFEARFFRGCVITGRSNSNSLGYISSITLADGTSIGYDASNRAVVREGTTVKLNPYYNKEGYIVGNWTDVNGNVVSEDESLIIKVNEDVTYTANFEPVSYKLTVRANDDSYGTVNAVSEIESGKTIKVGNAMVATITATPYDGYKFVYWTKGSDVVSYDAEYTVPAIADVSETEDTEYVANFVELETAEPGVYYRFAYEFPAAAAASAARTGATRAAGDTYTYAVNYGTGTSNNISNSKAQEWVYTNNTNEPTLTLRATVAGSPVYAINMGANATANPKLYTHNDNSNTETPVKYTLAVSEDYIITNYSFEYFVYYINYGFTINSTSPATKTWLEFSSGDVNAQTAEFTISSTNKSSYMIVKNFTVTIQEVGSSEGEGEGDDSGDETVNLYYMQSEACDVTNKTNALVMTQDGESASSIFYYDNNKLLSYKEGRYLDESNSARGLQAVGAAGGNVEIIDNKIKVSSGTTMVYLHANKDNGTYFVDRCTSNDGSDNGDEEHNFVIEEVTTLPVTISSVLHATFFAPVAVEIPEGVTAYVLKADNIPGIETYAWMTSLKKGIIPANTGVILKGAEGTHYFNITESTDAARAEAVGNVLRGTVAKTNVTQDAYILAYKDRIGLYPLANNSYITGGTTATFTNGSHKAYLPVTDDWFGEQLKKGTGFHFVYDDETTEIEDVETENVETIYDLQGRKLNEITQPGIYIVGGKKVWVK